MEELEHLEIQLEEIQLEEIKRATNSFSSRVIRKGKFWTVYEGEVSHARGRSIVAIMRLNCQFVAVVRQYGQGDGQFLMQIMELSRHTHQNLLSLLGYCDEVEEKVLVYEFASKGSLDRHLSDPDLTWVQRIKICLGAAKGLSYLHDLKRRRYQCVLHCDIKSANIFLDESLTAKVGDFGISRMPLEQDSILVTGAFGTEGYIDPLFLTTQIITKESDVYSFGVVLFEVLCGRLCIEQSNGQSTILVNMWKEKFSENKLNEIVFQHLEPQMDPTSLELFSNVAFRCLHDSREARPTMSVVVEELEKALKFQENPIVTSSSSSSKITAFIKESKDLFIPFRVIEKATNNFTTVLGKGGYGVVYKGELLLSGELTSVAVKRLHRKISGQGFKEFLTEIQLLSRYKHPNVVSLLGFCDEAGEMILIYEYAEHGSLDHHLPVAKTTHPLTWEQKISICLGTARGLDYLHNHIPTDHRMIHRDIKSANILIGHGWKAMIADLGLSKIGFANESDPYLITNASGTHGYCDPAYMDTGILTKESDVYSFGVVMFEVLCGRLCFIKVDNEHRFLARLAPRYYETGRLNEIIDPYLKTEVDSDSLKMFSEIAYLCLLNERDRRPSMGLVVQKLEEMMARSKIPIFVPSPSKSEITAFIKGSKDLFIPFQVIKKATKEFSTVIGRGGYGVVYKGELFLSGELTSLAVKRLDRRNISGQGFKEFLTEIQLLSRYKHPNVVSLLGFCDEAGEKILIYKYAQHQSLDKHLRGLAKITRPLTWEQRISICHDAALGLDYLHNHSPTDHRVIHRDIKSANILIGYDWKAMIADLGLSKIGGKNRSDSYVITNAAGTPGYCDPAYMDIGFLTKESDVYSFGVVMFEVLCGRLGFMVENSEHRFHAKLAQSYYETGRLNEIIDPYLKTQVDSDSLKRFSDIAYPCLHNERDRRPSMSLVVQQLEEMMASSKVIDESPSEDEISRLNEMFKSMDTDNH